MRWLFSLPAAMFYCLTTTVMYEAAGSPSGIPGLAVVLAHYLLTGCIAFWVVTDARQHRRPLPYDYGSFVFFGWWVLVPLYLFSSRGWRGFIPLGGFVLLLLAAGIVGSVPAWFSAIDP
jgi:hypothetical protein